MSDNTDSRGLIMPKKLINPCLESMERQKLHRELVFNNKIGKSVLNQKSELQRAMEKQRQRNFINTNTEIHNKSPSISSELEKVITQRAQKLEDCNNKGKDDERNDERVDLNEEYMNVRAKLKGIDHGNIHKFT